eukprot:scaffold3612_cov124-Skeletonema_menzelii.AAC.1
MNDQKDSTIIMPPYSNNSNSDCTSSSSSRGSKPKAALHLSPTRKNNNDELLQLVAQELETMKQPKKQLHDQSSKQPAGQFSNHPRHHYNEQCFPPACLRLMSSLPGNLTCIDCHSRTDISWASVSFGCLMCLQCSGKHRSLGVQTSFVKSVSMDGWKVHEVLSMLEGGNEQLDQFFERHEMGKSGSVSGDGTTTNNKLTSPTATSLLDRYKTKAASFYRQHLINHAKELGEGGIYKGREASRSKNKKTSSSASSSRKHQRSQQEQQQPSKPKLLPTVTESSASMAESETATSNYDNNGNDDPSPPPLSPSQPLVKRQRSKGSGTNVSMEMSELDLDRME